MTVRAVASSVFAAVLGVAAFTVEARAELVGVTETEIVVGTHQDLSGPVTFWGVPAANGMRMRVAEINAAGGIHGRTLRLIVEDSGYDPKKAVLATQKMLTRDRVFAVVGALGSPTAVAAQRPVLERGRFHLFPMAPTEQVFDPFHPMKFGYFTPYGMHMRAAVDFMATAKNKKRIGVIYQDDALGESILAGIEGAAPDFGATIVATAGYKRGATAFASQVARLQAADVDVVMLGTIIRETVGVAAEAQKIGWDVDLIASVAAYADVTVKLGGAAVEGLYATGQTPIPYAEDATPEVRAWMDRYAEMFGGEVAQQAIAGYIVMDLFAHAAEAAGPDLTNETMLAALEAIADYRDVFGSPPATFGPDRRLGVQANFIAQVQNGRWARVTDTIRLDRAGN